MRGGRAPGTRFFWPAGTRPGESRDVNLTPDSIVTNLRLMVMRLTWARKQQHNIGEDPPGAAESLHVRARPRRSAAAAVLRAPPDVMAVIRLARGMASSTCARAAL